MGKLKAQLVLKVKKLHKDAIVPTKANITDAGFDLYALKGERIASSGIRAIETGIAIEVPEGYYAQVFERSGLSTQNTLKLKAGVIDCGYRGEIKVIMQNCGDSPVTINPKQKIAQFVILPVPIVTIEEVTELSDSERGTKGFGSSDKVE